MNNLKRDFKDWQLSDDNVENILHMMDSNFKEENILKNLKTLKRIPNGRCKYDEHETDALVKCKINQYKHINDIR